MDGKIKAKKFTKILCPMTYTAILKASIPFIFKERTRVFVSIVIKQIEQTSAEQFDTHHKYNAELFTYSWCYLAKFCKL